MSGSDFNSLRKQLSQIQSNNSLTSDEKKTQIAELLRQHQQDISEKYAQPPKESVANNEPLVTYHSADGKVLGCPHYKRKCCMLADCCQKWFTCRFCHDENSSHKIDRYATQEMWCMLCFTRQSAKQNCSNCGAVLGRYYCDVCKFWNDEVMDIYHCDGCRLCRVGKRDDYWHCVKCGLCFSVSVKDHACVADTSQAECPVCGECLGSSRKALVVFHCGHGMHEECYRQYIRTKLSCPVCRKSLAEASTMKTLWDDIDAQIAMQPMPAEFANHFVTILCNDCLEKSELNLHFLGHKCQHCGGYNTEVISNYIRK